jgi:hypothetical protein
MTEVFTPLILTFSRKGRRNYIALTSPSPPAGEGRSEGVQCL